MRSVSAMLAGFAMAATLTGFAGAASAAPVTVATETASTVAADYTTASGKYYMTFRTSTRCTEVAEWLAMFDGITDTWCLQGNAMGTAWHVYYEGRLT